MLKLFNTRDNVNVINKELTHMKDFNIKFKEKFSIISPTINLKIVDDFPINECNYCFISDFNRYYFIQYIEMLSVDVYKLHLECDVLESFKDDILDSYGTIEKKLGSGDYVQFSSNIEVRKDIDIHDSNKGVDGVKYIVLSTIGG